MIAIDRKYFGTGLLLLFFDVIYVVQMHGASFKPHDKSTVGFLSIFGLYLCLRALRAPSRRQNSNS
jgi:hypothetical protein